APIGEPASPTRRVTPASQKGTRDARPEPRERQRNRNEQETARQRSGTPVERLDQKIKRRGKEERTQGRGRLNYTNGQPPFLCVVMLRDEERNDHESTSSHRHPDHNPVREGQLPQILRKAHAEETGRHEENSSENDPYR